MLKRSMALALCLVLLVSAFCGCGSSTGKNNAELKGNTYVSGFPIVKQKEKLTVMGVQLANHGDFDEMGFTTEYEKLTNIDIEWQLIQAEDIESKVALACASGNLPDVMCILDDRLPNSIFMKYSADGTFIQLDKLIDEYAPNVKKMFETYPQTKVDTLAADGKIYSLPHVNVASDNQLRFPYKFYIRQTWLDNLNLEVPTTLEQFYQVLTAFRDDDPNGNGQPDEIPFAMAGIVDAYFGNWGMSFSYNTGYLAVDDNGKVHYAYAADATKKGLSYLNRLTSQGLAQMMDTDNKFQSKVRSGVVGAFYGLDKYVVAGDEVGEEYTMIAPLSAGDGSKPTISVSNSVVPNAVLITKACKNPSAAMRWIDYLYSTEGALLVNYGADGQKITKIEDGKYDYVKKNASVDSYTYAPGHSLPCLLDDTYYNAIIERDDSDKLLREKQDEELIADVKNILMGKYEPKNEIGVLMLDSQAATVEEKYYEVIREYAIEMVNKFASGELNVETGWETYIQEINKKGLSELLKEYQRIYDSKQAK